MGKNYRNTRDMILRTCHIKRSSHLPDMLTQPRDYENLSGDLNWFISSTRAKHGKPVCHMPNTFRLSLHSRIVLGILTPGQSTCSINMTRTHQLIEIHRSYDLCRLYGVWLASVVASLPILSHRITRTNRIDEELITHNDVIYMIPAALELFRTLDAPERLIP